MKELILKIKATDYKELQKLITDFSSYYEDDCEWSFENLDEQREIAYEIVEILKSLKVEK